ncbi:MULTISPECIES: glutaredoxin-like protein NrdH [unclassified Pannonibacter]|uniref:glutaredoxin-like protein NrdH n=1 Tax=unclassified Pannonibacter TaxID=2627228 RepID=UPI0016474B1A|nr:MULTISPECIES: glutaredoxin-like protein NrdH [unclassified Pannonibacter]
MSVTVYSKPACVQCTATIRALDQREIPYEVIDLTVDQYALEMVQSLGFRQVPVVTTDDDQWSGFRPDKIKGLVERELAAKAKPGV